MMGVGLAVVTGIALASQHPTAYSDADTEALIARARVAHAEQMQALIDYHVDVHTRIDLSESRDLSNRATLLGVVEYVATLHWSRPGDARLEYRGLRKHYAFRMLPGPIPFFDIDQDDLDDPRIEEPWILPHTLGDRVRLVCCDFQARPALHPLSPHADGVYSFDIQDSITLNLQNRTVHLIAVNVLPRTDTVETMVGRIWIERDTGHVVKLVVRLLGDRLFSDNPSGILNRVFQLEADIEYALVEEFWLPSSQQVTLAAHDDLVTGTVMPLRFQTVFTDYVINANPAAATSSATEPRRAPLDQVDTNDPELQAALDLVARSRDPDGGIHIRLGELGDLMRAIRLLEQHGIESGLRLNNGNTQTGQAFSREAGAGADRWTVSSPSMDSLEAYSAWSRPIPWAENSAEPKWQASRSVLDSLIGQVPDSVHVRGRSGSFRLGEIFRFNRVQGLSFGGSYLQPLTSGRWMVRSLSSRFGLSDKRPTGRVTVRRAGGTTSMQIAAFHELHDVGVFSSGTSFGNTLNSLIAGHDDADYYLVSGVDMTVSTLLGRASAWSWSVGARRHRSVTANSHYGMLGSDQRSNPAVSDQSYIVVSASLSGSNLDREWELGLEGLLNSERLTGRFWSTLREVHGPLSITARAGIAPTEAPSELLFRAGGPFTVRGYPYGERVGAAAWALQTELAFPTVLRIRPYIFGDVGNAAALDHVFRDEPLIGFGAGLAMSLIITELKVEASTTRWWDESRNQLRLDLRLR